MRDLDEYIIEEEIDIPDIYDLAEKDFLGSNNFT